jgi:hypothetical protein
MTSFQYSVDIAYKDFTNYTLNVTLNNNCSLLYLTVCTVDYELVAIVISPPLHLDYLLASTLTGSMVDTSGVSVNNTSNIFCGMTDMTFNDTNTNINYTIVMSDLSYSIRTI